MYACEYVLHWGYSIVLCPHLWVCLFWNLPDFLYLFDKLKQKNPHFQLIPMWVKLTREGKGVLLFLLQQHKILKSSQGFFLCVCVFQVQM